MSRTLFTDLNTQSRIPVLLGFLVDTHCRCRTPIVFNCSTWSFIMASRARQATIESSNLLFTGVVYNRFEHRVTRWKVSDRRQIVYLICVSNAWVLTKSVKIDQSEGIPDPGIPERPFVKFSHRRSLASSRRAFFIFSRTVFCTAPWLTERLEEAMKGGNSWQKLTWWIKLAW